MAVDETWPNISISVIVEGCADVSDVYYPPTIQANEPFSITYTVTNNCNTDVFWGGLYETPITPPITPYGGVTTYWTEEITSGGHKDVTIYFPMGITDSISGYEIRVGHQVYSVSKLYVADDAVDRLYTLQQNNGLIITYFTCPDTWPIGITKAQDGTFYTIDHNYPHKLYHISALGAVLGSTTLPFMDSPYGVAIGSDGYLWVSDEGTNRILKITTDGNYVRSFDIDPICPYGLDIDKDGYLWVADSADDKVYKIHQDGTVLASFSTPGGSPYGLVSSGVTNNIWLTNAGASPTIYQLTKTGTVISSFPAPNNAPRGITLDYNERFAGNVLYESYNYDDDGYDVIASGLEDALGQTFTPTTSHYINSIKLKLYKEGNPGPVIASIRNTEDSGGNLGPTGTALTTGTTDGNTLTTNEAGEWRTITFNNPVFLQQNTTYAIALQTPSANSSNTLNWRLNGPAGTIGTYWGGMYWYSWDYGASGSWIGNPWTDFMFEEYGYQ